MAFCQEWRLPMNSVWLFSTRKSVTTFFAAYDALREEGTATSVCKVLDEVADLSLPGSIDYMKVQGEILEGLVARIVNCETLVHLEKVLKDSHSPSLEGAVDFDLGPSLREIFTANRSNEWQQMIELLHGAGDSLCPDFSDWVETETAGESVKANESLVSKFLEACPADFCTAKMQEMICLMRAIGSPVNIQCHHSYARAVSSPSHGLSFKMAIYGKCESAFRRYRQELRGKPGLWPFYRGIFLDVSLFKANKDNVGDIMTNDKHLVQSGGDGGGTLEKDGLADEDVNLMIKLGFLPYRLRASLIRNGLSILFKEGRAAYRAYYLRQMKAWGTSSEKQLALGKMLDEWSFYVRNLQLSPSMYLNEAEPFLKKYAERSRDNNTLVGYAGNLVTSEYFLAFVEDGTVVGSDENLARAENFLAICEDGTDKEVEQLQELAVLMLTPSVKRSVSENDCLIVFFPGMPGSAKSGLCREISNAKGGLGDGRQVHWLMGDYVRGVRRNYWKELTDECRKRRHSIILADKNVPNEEAWGLIENICKENSASAVPVVNDSEGTNSNPFSLSALAVFMSRVFQRDYHTGNLDKASPKAGFILLMFYHIHEGKNREAFECKLIERFGSLVKVPLLKSDRIPLPEPIDSTLQEGMKLYKLHNKIHPRLDSLDGVFSKEWAQWEKKLQKVIHENSMYLNSIQVPFELMVMRALEQLRNIASGGSTIPSSERQKFGSLALAAVSLPISDVQGLLNDIALKNPRVDKFLKDKHVKKSLLNTFVSLAHKRSHGVTAVASYGPFLHQKIPVDLTALLFSEEVAALEACLGSTDGESITSRDQWPHVTIWTKVASDAEANSLPQLVVVGKAIRIDIDPPASMLGTLEFL